MHNHSPSCAQKPQIYFGKFISSTTFVAHKLDHSEPLFYYKCEVWQLLPAPNSNVRKTNYIGAHLFSALNLCRKILLKSFCYLYEVGRTNFFAEFWSFRNFRLQFRENYGATYRQERELSSASERAITSEKRWKQHQHRPINYDTILVQSMSLTCRQTKRDKEKTIFAPTAGARSLISTKLCMQIEDVVTILKCASHFSIQRLVFPTESKMLMFWPLTHWVNSIPAGMATCR